MHLSLKEDVPSLLSRGLGLLRWRLFLLLLLFLLFILLWCATLGTSTGGDAGTLPRSLCRWFLLFRGSFGFWFGFLGASRFLATISLGLLFLFLIFFFFLLLLGLLVAVIFRFGIFLRVRFGGGSAFGWLVLGPWFIFVTAATLFVLFRDLASL